MTAISDIPARVGKKKKPTWPEQRERFRQLQAHKLNWWRALLSNSAVALVAAAYIRRCTNEPFPLGVSGVDKDETAKRAVSLDPFTDIASALLSDLDEIEIGNAPIKTHEIFEEIRKDCRQRPLRDTLTSTICADAPEMQTLAASVRRSAIAYRVLHDELVTANLGLVHGQARRHQYRLPHEDLANEGVFGLMKAVHRFDPERGFQFSTFAVQQIRSYVSGLVHDGGSTVRIPRHVHDLAYRIRRALPSFSQRPTDEELRDAVNADGLNTQCNVEHITVARRAMITAEPRSLDAPLGRGEASFALIDVVPDGRPSLDEEVGLSLESIVSAILVRMPRLNADAFRYAVGDDETLEQVGLRHGVSREYVRQLSVKALDHVRRELAKRSARKQFGALPLRSTPRADWPTEPSREAKPARVAVIGVACEVCGETSAESYKDARLTGWQQRWLRQPIAGKSSRKGSLVQLYRCPSCVEKRHPDIVVSPDRYLACKDDPLTLRCYECEVSVTMILRDARNSGWCRFKIICDEDGSSVETREEVCPTCTISEGYLSEAQMLARHNFWEGGGLARPSGGDIKCDVCEEAVAESSKSARLSGWRKRWAREGGLRKQQDVCPGCVRKSGRRSRAPELVGQCEIRADDVLAETQRERGV